MRLTQAASSLSMVSIMVEEARAKRLFRRLVTASSMKDAKKGELRVYADNELLMKLSYDWSLEYEVTIEYREGGKIIYIDIDSASEIMKVAMILLKLND